MKAILGVGARLEIFIGPPRLPLLIGDDVFLMPEICGVLIKVKV